MRRTTICRSSRLVVASLALGLVAAPVVAQDQAAARPQTVVVQPGHTLWGLAELHLGDPFLWPAIYRLNTDVVEDPHWIYPGEVLVLVPGTGQPEAEGPAIAQLAPEDTVRIDVPTVPGEPVEAVEVFEVEEAPPVEGPTVFSQARERPVLGTSTESRFSSVDADMPFRPVRRGEFYSAGFLTEGDDLPFGHVDGNIDQPVIQALTRQPNAVQFQHVAVRPPEGGSYNPGDQLWILEQGAEVRGFGHIMVPAGLATVSWVEEDRAIAEVDKNYARVRDRLVALPLEPFNDPGDARPVGVEDGITGHVVAMRGDHPFLSPQDHFFIDLGVGDGVTLGDLFGVVRPIQNADGSVGEHVAVIFTIVHVRQNTATAVAVWVRSPDVEPGDMVRLLRKMPM